jgi:fatty-acyl-CoA synthase
MDLTTLCPLTVPDALTRTVALAPDIEAIVASDGRATFVELNAQVAEVRQALLAAGIDNGDHVGLCIGNTRSWIVLFLALGSIGAVTVPINTRFRSEELAYGLRQSRVVALFVADRVLNVDFVSMLHRICPELDSALPDSNLPDLRQIIVLGPNVPAGAISYSNFMAVGRGHGSATAWKPRPDDVLLIQYTSGTTSFPKGVMLTHANMLANAFVSGDRIGFRAGDRFHSARPFFHVAGSTLSVLASLQHAVTLVTMDRFEPEEALRLMEEERCTHFSGNDTMALMLLNHPSRQQRKLCLRGGWAAGSPTVLRRIIDELGARECVAGYGLSEASPNVAQSCWWEPEEVRVASRMRVQPGVEVDILDENGVVQQPGQPGEIVVRGWNVMRGYFDKPKETADVLSSDGWLSTGDLGRLGSDNRLEFLGRLKDIVRVGGENVSPAEVEDMLHRHPAIRQAAIVGVPDPRLTEVVAAFVIAREGIVCDPDDVIAWSREHMAGFKVPRHVWVVEEFETIGMTASSKIQKRQLAAHARGLLGLSS